MVLSDPEYQVKFQIPSSATQDDVVSIIFKRLAGSDDDNPLGNVSYELSPLGRYDDTLESFRAQGYNRVNKRWIPLGSNHVRSPSNQGSPHRDARDGCPRALLLFFLGDSAMGKQAIAAEIRKGSASEESVINSGTPTVPFGEYLNKKGGSTTPLRDNRINNASASQFNALNGLSTE